MTQGLGELKTFMENRGVWLSDDDFALICSAAILKRFRKKELLLQAGEVSDLKYSLITVFYEPTEQMKKVTNISSSFQTSIVGLTKAKAMPTYLPPHTASKL